MIVKVQVSLVTTEEVPQVLIYNRDRSVEWVGDASADLMALMDDRPKVFFVAQVIDSKIHLGHEAGWRDW